MPDSPDATPPGGPARTTAADPAAGQVSTTAAAPAGGPAGPLAGEPVLRIVAGQPTAEETAAVVVVLSALASQPAAASPAPARSQWAARSRLLREPVSPGPGGWRASALPR